MRFKTYQQGYEAGFADVMQIKRKPQADLRACTPFQKGYIDGLNNGWSALMAKQREKRSKEKV